MWRAALLIGLLVTGQKERGRELYEELAREDFTTLPRDMIWFTTLSLLGWACELLRDAERAPVLYRTLLPYRERTVQDALAANWGSVERFLGSLAAVTGDFETACAHFEIALERNAAWGMRQAVRLTRAEYAQVLLARGGPGDAERATRAAARRARRPRGRGATGARGLRARAARRAGAPPGLSAGGRARPAVPSSCAQLRVASPRRAAPSRASWGRPGTTPAGGRRPRGSTRAGRRRRPRRGQLVPAELLAVAPRLSAARRASMTIRWRPARCRKCSNIAIAKHTAISRPIQRSALVCDHEVHRAADAGDREHDPPGPDLRPRGRRSPRRPGVRPRLTPIRLPIGIAAPTRAAAASSVSSSRDIASRHAADANASRGRDAARSGTRRARRTPIGTITRSRRQDHRAAPRGDTMRQITARSIRSGAWHRVLKYPEASLRSRAGRLPRPR